MPLQGENKQWAQEPMKPKGPIHAHGKGYRKRLKRKKRKWPLRLTNKPKK